MSLTKLSLGRNNLIFPPRENLVNDIPAGVGNYANLFLQCRVCHCTDVHHTTNDIWLDKTLLQLSWAGRCVVPALYGIRHLWFTLKTEMTKGEWVSVL